MMMSELIAKKRDGLALSGDEIKFMIDGYTCGVIPDYQMSAMLMAVYLNGLSQKETLELTMAMMDSGEKIDLSSISGIKADKHSTGGVGDKTSLALCPMVASLGVKMAKMSGRGLGHTGGTIDKLGSIPGFSCELTEERFLENVEKVGFAIASQTKNIDPADKKLYALRDVTATVESMPLIVSSIMSKKLAAGADVVVLDVKTGSGAFMKTQEDSEALAREMVDIGTLAGKKTVAVVTDMDEPLGYAVGNALEVKEAISVLRGEDAGNLRELCLTLGANILVECGRAENPAYAREMLEESIANGAALSKFAEFVQAQGGDTKAVYDTQRLPKAPVIAEVKSPEGGFVSAIEAEAVGRVCLHLGGGRETKESVIDPSVGIVLVKKRGDRVTAGDTLAYIHAQTESSAASASEMLLGCYSFSPDKQEQKPFIRRVVRYNDRKVV